MDLTFVLVVKIILLNLNRSHYPVDTASSIAVCSQKANERAAIVNDLNVWGEGVE